VPLPHDIKRAAIAAINNFFFIIDYFFVTATTVATAVLATEMIPTVFRTVAHKNAFQ
jgi:hypothetical protein